MNADPNEQFAGNSSINADIHELLNRFGEPSNRRMRKKLRQDRAALLDQGTDQADAQARHTFREFLVADQLNCNGFDLEYSKKIGTQTPDWYDEGSKLLLEVFTCERGRSANQVRRVGERFLEKAAKYETIVKQNNLHFVIAVHGDFISCFDSDDCQQAIRDGKVFETCADLSGVIYFGETHVVTLQNPDGSSRKKQLYDFPYFANPIATRAINLSDKLKYKLSNR